MQIVVINPQVLGHEPYQPTASPFVFVKPDGAVLILEGDDKAYRITTK